MNIQDISTLDYADFSQNNQYKIFLELSSLERQIFNMKTEIFASAFLHYFHENPEAILFVVGPMSSHQDNHNDFSGIDCSVFRIDTLHVQRQTAILNPTLASYGQIETGYVFNPKFLTNNHLTDFNDLPGGVTELYQSQFNIFTDGSSDILIPIWQNIGMDNGGCVYGIHNLNQLMNRFCVDDTLKASVERQYLQKSVNLYTANKSATANLAL